MIVNINQYVRVKLTDHGREILRRKHDERNNFAQGSLGEFIQPKEDENGWAKFQLWDLMNCFGSSIDMGKNVPFSTTIEIVEGD